MARFEPSKPLPGFDPVPNVATPADIQRAEELRHRIEDRYLHPTAAPTSPAKAEPDAVH